MVRHLYHINNNKGKDSSGDSNGSHSSNNSKENGHHRKAMEVLVILLAIHLKVLLVSNTSLDLLLHILISNRDRDREDNKDVDKCLHNKLNMVNSSKIHDLIQHNRHSSSNVVTVILNNRSNSIIHHMSILVGTIKIYRKNRYKYDVLFSIL